MLAVEIIVKFFLNLKFLSKSCLKLIANEHIVGDRYSFVTLNLFVSLRSFFKRKILNSSDSIILEDVIKGTKNKLNIPVMWC